MKLYEINQILKKLYFLTKIYLFLLKKIKIELI